MSKRKGNAEAIKKCKSITVTSQHINKHGKIKGKTKKETKLLEGMYPYYKLTNKGKLKLTADPGVDDNDKQVLVDRVTGDMFRAGFFEVDETKKITKDFKELVNNAKFMAVTIGADPKTVEYWCQLGAIVSSTNKQYKRLAKIGKKASAVKNNGKHKKDKDRSGSSSLGGWSTR